MRTYMKPEMDCEIFMPDEFIATCYNCNVTVAKNEHFDVDVPGVGMRYNIGNTACGTEIDYPAESLIKVTYGASSNDDGGFGGGGFGGDRRNNQNSNQKTAYFFIEEGADVTDYTKWHVTDGNISSNHS